MTTTTTTTTTIKKIPAPESYICLWCKREIPAGEESLLVKTGGTSLYSCMECGGHVKIPKPRSGPQTHLHHLRTSRNLTQSDMSRLFGGHQGAWSLYERQALSVPRARRTKIAAYFGVAPALLFDEKGMCHGRQG